MQLAAGVAGVRRALRLDEQDVGLLVGPRAMLDAAGTTKARPGQLDVAVAQLDRQTPSQHQEEVVGVVVLVPDELALTLTTASL